MNQITGISTLLDTGNFCFVFFFLAIFLRKAQISGSMVCPELIQLTGLGLFLIQISCTKFYVSPCLPKIPIANKVKFTPILFCLLIYFETGRWRWSASCHTKWHLLPLLLSQMVPNLYHSLLRLNNRFYVYLSWQYHVCRVSLQLIQKRVVSAACNCPLYKFRHWCLQFI